MPPLAARRRQRTLSSAAPLDYRFVIDDQELLKVNEIEFISRETPSTTGGVLGPPALGEIQGERTVVGFASELQMIRRDLDGKDPAILRPVQ